MAEATRRMTRKMTAPGPDGIHATMIAAAMPELGPIMRGTFNACLRDGVFPGTWKEANLVLIPKPGKPGKYRPICMLGETGKLLERIIAGRIVEHLKSVRSDLSANQFGFRRGRSTLDALRRVRKRVIRTRDERGRTLAISLDIRNAFNSL